VNDKESIIEIHSNVLQNENKAKIFVLYEAYFRGKFYKELSDKFKKNDEFLSYCENNLNVSVPTVYQYRNLNLLIDAYPSLILSGVCITKLHKNRKKIREIVKYDSELETLLTKPFPGLKSEISIADPTIDIEEDDNETLGLKEKCKINNA
jgi:hypothetical protein